MVTEGRVQGRGGGSAWDGGDGLGGRRSGWVRPRRGEGRGPERAGPRKGGAMNGRGSEWVGSPERVERPERVGGGEGREGSPNGWGGSPNGWGGRRARTGGGGPEGAGPRWDGAQNIAFFSSPATFFFLPSLSGRSFRGILVVFEASGS